VKGMSPALRIGIYCPGAGTGGPWRYVHALLRGVDLDEFGVTVFCDLPGEYEARSGVRVIRLSAGAGEWATARAERAARVPRPWLGHLLPAGARLWAATYRETRRLAGVFRANRCDLLHTQNTGCEESPIAARLAGVPRVVGTFHVDSTYDLEGQRSGPAHRTVEWVSNRCLHRAIAVSEVTGRDWIRRTRLTAERVVTIYNGIDPEQFRRRFNRGQARRRLGLPDDGRPIIGAAGRLDAAKGFTHLIEAVRLLAGEYPTLTLVLAGMGPLRESLEHQAAQAGLGERVRFLGFQEDVRGLYDALDVAVMSSLCEALPYALLEAMAHELPAVVTHVGGMPEVVVPGETGFVVPAQDAGALASALRPLLESGELRERLGRAGRERVARHFHEADCVRKTLDVYRELLGERRTSRQRQAVRS
jgi:glycosyltransferase involved in cell wall biosynthesis